MYAVFICFPTCACRPSRKVVRMNLEEIDMVLSVIRNKSFSLAAQELSYSQPTISKHIDSLEKELRIKLFNRKTRAQIELTPEGEQLVPFFEEVQQATRRLTSKSAAIRESNDLLLRFSCPHGLSTLGEDEIVLRFAAAHPSIKVEQFAETNMRILQMLKDRQVDAGFIARVDDTEYSDLILKTWRKIDVQEFRLKIAIPKKHRLANREGLTLSDFKNDCFLFRTYRDDMRADPKAMRFVEACRAEGFEPNIKFTEGRGSLLLGLIASGKYVAPLMYRPRTTRHDIEVKQFSKDYYHFKLQLLYDMENDSAALRMFADFVKKLDMPLG